eukprot:162758-Chlamydomonas_euryale.AAC.1
MHLASPSPRCLHCTRVAAVASLLHTHALGFPIPSLPELCAPLRLLRLLPVAPSPCCAACVRPPLRQRSRRMCPDAPISPLLELLP